MTMKSDDFLREEYIKRREEIKETKDRIFTICHRPLDTPRWAVSKSHYGSGDSAFNCAIFSSKRSFSISCRKSQFYAMWALHTPTYREKIPDTMGWENWLESDDSCAPRIVDKYVAYSIYIVLRIYCVASIVLCWNYSRNVYGSIPSTLLVGIYTGLGVVFISYLLNNVRSATTTRIGCKPSATR
jgi:hypothetical protein